MKTIDGKNYYTDAKGKLIPEGMIKEYDKLKDSVIQELFTQASATSNALKSFKEMAMGEVQALLDVLANEHGVKMGGKKGNINLTSFDGRLKIRVSVAEHIIFDEQLSVAKSLIDACISEWSVGASDNIKVLVQNAFEVDKSGRLSLDRITGLRRLKIDDDMWQRAMVIIGESMQVVGSKAYINFYELQADGAYKLLNLDIAAV